MSIKSVVMGADKKSIVITMDFLTLDVAPKSASGKTLVASSSNGFDWSAFKGLGISANVIYSNKK